MRQENLTIWKTRLKTAGSILSWTSLVLLIFIAIFLLYVGISSKLYATKGSAYEPKFSLYTIISPSMQPNLNVYDTIIDKRVDDVSEVEIGDVITFISTSSLSRGMTVTHRVIDIIKAEDGTIQFKTKGDNNLTPDTAYVTEPNILGRVILRIPQLGRIQFFLANQGGLLLIVVVPSIIVLIRYIMKLIRLTQVQEKIEKNLNESSKTSKMKKTTKKS